MPNWRGQAVPQPTHAMQLRDGIVKNVMAKDIASMISDGWTILDVRPPGEVQKVQIKGAVEVPIFVPDTSRDPSTLLKQLTQFGMGGWWLGGAHMKPNDRFLADVQAKVCALFTPAARGSTKPRRSKIVTGPRCHISNGGAHFSA
jgi:hypothetical protein